VNFDAMSHLRRCDKRYLSDLPGLGESSPAEDDVTNASASATDDVVDV